MKNINYLRLIYGFMIFAFVIFTLYVSLNITGRVLKNEIQIQKNKETIDSLKLVIIENQIIINKQKF